MVKAADDFATIARRRDEIRQEAAAASLKDDIVKSTESILRDMSPIDFGKLHYKECPATRGENWCNCEFIQAFVTSEVPTENLRKLDNR